MTIAANPYSLYLHDTGNPTFKSGEILCFRPARNSHGKSDVTGVFQPEAEAFVTYHGLDPDKHIVVLDNNKSRYSLANEVIREIKDRQPKTTAFFCHGFTHYIQLGPRSPNHPFAQENDKKLFRKFCKALADAYDAPTLLLYACSTGNDPDKDEPDTAPGAGDGSFADVCRDKMCEYGAVWCRVMAHTTAGPATINPYIKLFDGNGSRFGGTGAAFIVPPGTAKFWKALRRHLQTDDSFRFRFPYMTLANIQEELSNIA